MMSFEPNDWYIIALFRPINLGIETLMAACLHGFKSTSSPPRGRTHTIPSSSMGLDLLDMDGGGDDGVIGEYPYYQQSVGSSGTWMEMESLDVYYQQTIILEQLLTMEN
ncbi:hypothetical protein NE237_011209 [Protea cynaroides]|uniref:Uncharacterized protein n=1 Tax=Protea cynaroides TaxID=273540 RepID=A0A9Q0GUI5_9MAGN|nr:hypothetical protein NE237_011209 [Protea cynaroides]